MNFRKLQPKEVPQAGTHWVALNHETERSVGGAFFAVEWWMNGTDIPGQVFPEPYDTAPGRHRERQDAIDEGYELARDLDLPYWFPELATGETTP